jgi:hypothetical protein
MDSSSDRPSKKFGDAIWQAKRSSGCKRIRQHCRADRILVEAFWKGDLPFSYRRREGVSADERLIPIVILLLRLIIFFPIKLKYLWKQSLRKSVVGGYVVGWLVISLLLALQVLQPTDWPGHWDFLSTYLLWGAGMVAFDRGVCGPQFDCEHWEAFFSGVLLAAGTVSFVLIGWSLVLLIAPCADWNAASVIAALPGFAVLDALTKQLRILLVDRYRKDFYVQSISRSIVLLFLNFATLILSFAYLYQLRADEVGSVSCDMITGAGGLSAMESVYFSIMTISTLGYGSCLGLTQNAAGLVMAETTFGFVFAVFVVAAFVGAYQGPSDRGRAPR